MAQMAWPSLARTLAWIMAGAFVLATVFFILFAFQVFGGPPEPGEVFVDNVLADFAWQQTQWPLEFAGTALFAIGFLTLGAFAPVLGRLAGTTDARRGLVTAAFLGAAGLGAASQLLWLGAKPIATSPQYCDCGLLAEEVMSRLMTLNIVGGAQTWLVSGAMIAAAVGLVVAGQLGREAGMPGAWLWVALLAAGLAVVGSLLPLFDVYPFDVLLIVLVAGILFPIWAVWLASRAWDIWPSEGFASEVVSTEPADDHLETRI
jgi:hypothetical protein